MTYHEIIEMFYKRMLFPNEVPFSMVEDELKEISERIEEENLNSDAVSYLVNCLAEEVSEEMCYRGI